MIPESNDEAQKITPMAPKKKHCQIKALAHNMK